MRETTRSRFLPAIFLLLTVLFSIGCNKSGGGPSSPEKQQLAQTKIFAYSSAQYHNAIFSFELSKTDGTLTPTASASIAADALPMITAAAPDAKFLLSANYSGNSVSSYAINPSTGELTLVQTLAMGTGAAPAWVTMHPTKSIAYIANSGNATISILQIDASGALSIRSSSPAGAGVTSLAITSAGSALFSADQNVNKIGAFEINTNGDLSARTSATLGAGTSPNQIVLSPDERSLYVANWGTHSVSALSVNGTALTALGPDVDGGSNAGVYMVAVSLDGRRLFASKPYGNEYSVHEIAPNGSLGPATVVAKTGAVNFAFWGDYGYVVSWASQAAGLPIETRSYTSETGMATSGISTPTAMRGLYQLTIVEIPQ